MFVELLSSIPNTLETRRWVLINDYARAREIFNIQLPGPTADADEFGDYLLALSADVSPRIIPGPFISGFTESAFFQFDRPRYLAFDIREVDQSVEAGLPPNVLEVARGRFDPIATDQSLKACSECAVADLQERRGVTFYSWGEDLQGNLESRFLPPAFDRFGGGGRIAVMDRYVFRTVETPGMHSLIDASSGTRRSLADSEEFRLLAQGMTALDAYSILLTDTTHEVGEQIEPWLSVVATQADWERMVELRETFPVLRSYQALGTGAGKDDKGQYMAVVLVHADESSAIENAALLRARFLDAPPIPSWELEPFAGIVDSVETQTDGRTLLAKVRAEELTSRWIRWALQLYPLFPHE